MTAKNSTRAIQPQLEKYDYDFLEVSSPGIDRPLKTPRDYERHLGDEVEVKLFKAVDGVKLFTGILAGLDEENNILLDTPNGQLSFPKKAAATVSPWWIWKALRTSICPSEDGKRQARGLVRKGPA